MQSLSHIISRAKGQSDKNDLAYANQFLKHLDKSHHAPIATHESNDYSCTTAITLDCLLNHLVTAFAIIWVEHIEHMAVCSLLMLIKFALKVACSVQEFSCLLVPTPWIGRKKHIVRVHCLQRITRRDVILHQIILRNVTFVVCFCFIQSLS